MTNSPDNVPSEVPFEIDVQSVKGLLESQTDYLLIDCREQNEFDQCRIEGSVLLPMNETPDRVGEIEPHRGKPIVVHCHHGGRSGQVVQWLRSQGFETAQNMTGGIDVWSQLVDPTVARY